MESKVIFGDVEEFAVLVDPVSRYGGFIYGEVNFIIDGVMIFPERVSDYTLNIVVHSLKRSFSRGECVVDVGSMSVEGIDFFSGDEGRLIRIDGSELENDGLVLFVGFDGEEERLFFSVDFGESIREKRLRKGTVESVILNLPDFC
ncbi:immunity 42 family protein [Chromobacterium vaccinii]|nr:immunity 42 family protein [Chromobacterium vaccinii]